MRAYGSVKIRNFYCEDSGHKFFTKRHPVVVKKAEERRRNKPLLYPNLQDE